MAQASKKRAPEAPVIPDRLYFKIGDVARICGVANSVLRFWETQFPQLKPNKSGTGQRLYRRRDVELALEIKQLVHGDGFTIAGARHALESGSRRVATPPGPAPVPSAGPASALAPVSAPALVSAGPALSATPQTGPDRTRSTLAQVRNELREIAALLAAPPAQSKRDRVKVMKPRSESGNLFEV